MITIIGMSTMMENYTKESLEVFLDNMAEIAFPSDSPAQPAQKNREREPQKGIGARALLIPALPSQKKVFLYTIIRVVFITLRIIEENNLFPVGFRIQGRECAFV